MKQEIQSTQAGYEDKNTRSCSSHDHTVEAGDTEGHMECDSIFNKANAKFLEYFTWKPQFVEREIMEYNRKVDQQLEELFSVFRPTGTIFDIFLLPVWLIFFVPMMISIPMIYFNNITLQYILVRVVEKFLQAFVLLPLFVLYHPFFAFALLWKTSVDAAASVWSDLQGFWSRT
jgi:hypothetical protein